MAKKRKVVLEGTEALSVVEARCLIMAAMKGRFIAVMPGEVSNVEAACEKVAAALVAAGQDDVLVQKLLNDW